MPQVWDQFDLRLPVEVEGWWDECVGAEANAGAGVAERKAQADDGDLAPKNTALQDLLEESSEAVRCTGPVSLGPVSPPGRLAGAGSADRAALLALPEHKPRLGSWKLLRRFRRVTNGITNGSIRCTCIGYSSSISGGTRKRVCQRVSRHPFWCPSGGEPCLDRSTS